MKPIFWMMVGLPYSGKSYEAEKLKENLGAVIHSSDAIREEILGDVQDQTANSKVFEVLHERVINDLKDGKNVVYDATNLNYKRRMDFLQHIKKIPCQKVCVFMATPFDVCVERSKHRERVVPYEVLERMYKQIWIPDMYEGWDYISLVYPDGFKTLSMQELFNGSDGLNFIDQDNPHHSLTIGHHCIAAYGAVGGGSEELQDAALLHDIGKKFTKGFVNSKGEPSDTAHYYEHQHVSAYDSLFYTSPSHDRIRVASIIQWHMRPFEIERSDNKDKLYEKFRAFVGDQLYNDVMTLHKADISAKGIS